MFDVRRTLQLVDPEVVVEIATASDGVSEVITIQQCQDPVFLTRVFDALGFTPSETNTETAAFGVLTFTNESEHDDFENEYEANDETLEGFGSDADQLELSSSRDVPIDGDGRAFTVLVDPDAHKLAGRIYSQMLFNEEDMSKYGSFLYDFDNFLSLYMNPDPPEDEDEEDEDAPLSRNKIQTKEKDEVPAKKTEKQVAEDEAEDEAEEEDEDSTEKAFHAPSYPTVADIAEVFFTKVDGDHFYREFAKYLPETADKINPVVKAIIVIIGKIVLGAIGRALLIAWERKDKGMFERALFAIVKLLLNDYFPRGGDDSEDMASRYYREFDEMRYGSSTIDLDDYDYEVSAAYSEIAGMASADFTEAEIANLRFTRLLMAIVVRVMAGHLGRLLADAWLRKDKATFHRHSTALIERIMDYFPKEEKASIDIESSITAEIAKKAKNGRSAFLSAFMKAASGSLGDKLVRAWDAGDPEMMWEAMGTATEKVLEQMPIDEEKLAEVEKEDTLDPLESDAPEKPKEEQTDNSPENKEAPDISVE